MVVKDLSAASFFMTSPSGLPVINTRLLALATALTFASLSCVGDRGSFLIITLDLQLQ